MIEIYLYRGCIGDIGQFNVDLRDHSRGKIQEIVLEFCDGYNVQA